jgi:hypothetical protein
MLSVCNHTANASSCFKTANPFFEKQEILANLAIPVFPEKLVHPEKTASMGKKEVPDHPVLLGHRDFRAPEARQASTVVLDPKDRRV